MTKMSKKSKSTILLLGETQSGKSTLVEAFKRYADHNYIIDDSKIGGGNVSLTTDVHESSIVSNLPQYVVYRSGDVKNPKKRPVAIDKLIQRSSDDYEDLIGKRKGYAGPSHLPRQNYFYREFVLVDTPGLNDTGNRDEGHVFKIFQALGDRSIDLVLITVPQGPLTPSLQAALRSYMELFPHLSSIMAFVHTKVDYSKLHPESTYSQASMKERMSSIGRLIGRDSFPNFWIDCDFQTSRPVRKCLTNNVLRRILLLATRNEPVAMVRSPFLNKTVRMKEIDQIIRSQVEAVVQVVESTLKFSDEEEGILLRELYRKTTELNELRAKIQTLQDQKKSFETDDTELLYEKYFYDVQSKMKPGQREKAVYRGKTVDVATYYSDYMTLEPGPWKKRNGEWELFFVKNAMQRNGCFHVRLYAKRCNLFKKEIESLDKELDRLMEELMAKEKQHAQFSGNAIARIQNLAEEQNRHTEVLRLTNSSAMEKGLFTELLRQKAYIGGMSEVSEKVGKVYHEYTSQAGSSSASTHF